VCDADLSDHSLLQFNLQHKPVPQPKVLHSRRTFKNMDLAAFSAEVSSALSSRDTASDMGQLVSHYDQVMTCALDKYAPARTITLKGTTSKKWYDNEVHKARVERRRLERQFGETGLEVHRQMFREQSRLVVHMIEQKKANFYKTQFAEADCKETFRLVSGLISNNSQKSLPTDSDDMSLAQTFATYFDEKIRKIHSAIDTSTVSGEVCNDVVVNVELSSMTPQSTEAVLGIIKKFAAKSCSLDPIPTSILKSESVLTQVVPYITAIINQSLESGQVPDGFKVAQVTPLLKKEGLDCNILSNYRPVSNLPFVSKVLEKVVAHQLTTHLQLHGLHDSLQSAYRKGHSTETALLKIKADLDSILDKGDGVLLVMLDLSAAFDTLDHEILLRRLEHSVGLKGTALTWMRSYLSGRYQRVHINEATSDKFQLVTGVPQGSILGPLLFLIYILPLRNIVDSYHILRHGYADDSQLYTKLQLKFPQLVQDSIKNMESCLDDVRKWMVGNRLKLNDSKTEMLVIVRKDQRNCVDNIRVMVGDCSITPSKRVRNLGGVFDEEPYRQNPPPSGQ